MRRVPFVDFPGQYAEEREVLLARLDEIFAKGLFVGGPEIDALEEEVARFVGVRHAVALASGTDALIIALKALGIGPGDEVITPPNSFVASTSAIVEVGATPVFADVNEHGGIDPQAVEAAITKRTRAIMPVHLTGRMCDMDPLAEIAGREGVAVIEDAAQAIGSRYDGKAAGAWGTVGCFSAHPLKNVNAAGDAGFLTTNDDAIARFARLYRNIGLQDRDTMVMWGRVSRLDVVQAVILRLRLAKLPSVIERRRRNASAYRERLICEAVRLPVCREIEFNTFHTFVIQTGRRDELRRHLAEHGIETAIHYPVPIHLQPGARHLGYQAGQFPTCERQAGQILSLPIHQFLGTDDIAYVADQVMAFHSGGR
jgi:dTDP-4-amino-4,6-dideoxygalactose transaminase